MTPLYDQPVPKKTPKNKSQIYGPRSAQTEFCIKLKSLGTPKLCGRIRSNLNFKIILKVKKPEMENCLKSLYFYNILAKFFFILSIFENLL